MSKDKKSIIDLSPLEPYGEAAKIATQGVVDAAGAFLGRICLPAAGEFGLLLQDKVRAWRSNNLTAILQGSEQILKDAGINDELVHGHPRIVGTILEEGSWSDNATVQSMWAGLLASACTADGQDEGNLIFTSILADLTASQAKVLEYACEQSTKIVSDAGFIYAQDLEVEHNQIKQISGIADINRIDIELDHLRSLELILNGFDTATGIANIAPTALALNMFVRCRGSQESPQDFFKV